MDKVKFNCKACGCEVERVPKEPPKNQRQAKEVLFICHGCKAWNLRDGTARYKTQEIPGNSQETPGQPQEKPRKTQVKSEVKGEGIKETEKGYGFFRY